MPFQLNNNQRQFLDAYRIKGSGLTEDGVPLFVECGDGTYVHLSGYVCREEQHNTFLNEAPKGLWFGGGAVVVGVPQGIVSIPDRRHSGNLGPTAQGWAKYEEGRDLSRTALREYGEEVVMYVPGGEDDNLFGLRTEIVPAGVQPKGRVDVLNVKLHAHKEYGKIEFLGLVRNEKDRSMVWTGFWDLRQLEQVDRLRVIWNDDFPEECLPGTNPRVLDWESRQEIGGFEGMQGYLPKNMIFHPVLSKAWDCL